MIHHHGCCVEQQRGDSPQWSTKNTPARTSRSPLQPILFGFAVLIVAMAQSARAQDAADYVKQVQPPLEHDLINQGQFAEDQPHLDLRDQVQPYTDRYAEDQTDQGDYDQAGNAQSRNETGDQRDSWGKASTVQQVFEEVEILVRDSFDAEVICSFPRPPGGECYELTDPARVHVELPEETVSELVKSGVTLTSIRTFVLIEGGRVSAVGSSEAALAACAGSNQFGSNSTNVNIPDNNTWVYSPIQISGAPAGATTVCIDVHYEIIHSYIGDLDIDLNDQNLTYNYDLWGPNQGGSTDNLNQTVTGITTFNGELVNQQWLLYARDIDPLPAASQYIDYWWIRVYYDSGPTCTSPGLSITSSSGCPSSPLSGGASIAGNANGNWWNSSTAPNNQLKIVCGLRRVSDGAAVGSPRVIRTSLPLGLDVPECSPGGSFGATPWSLSVPTTPGNYRAWLYVAEADNDPAAIADFQGHNTTSPTDREKVLCFTVDVLGPEINCEDWPSTFPFGSICLGQCSSSQSLTVINEGGGFLQGEPSIIGPDASQFQFTCGYGSFNLGPGQSWPICVRFCPTSAGGKSATLRVISNDPNETPCDRPLSGIGIAPEINCEDFPSQFDFGNIAPGQCSGTQTVTIVNEGCGSLQGDPAIIGPDAGQFQCVSGCGSFNLGPGQSWQFGLRFCPTSCGTKNATFRVTSNDSNESPCDRPITGNGQMPPEINCEDFPSQLSFGTIVPGQCSGTQTVTIVNEGCGSLQGDPAIVGPDAGQFQCVSGCGSFSLGPGQSWQFGVRFCPTSCGTKNATLRVSSNDSNESPCDRPINGTGQAPADINCEDFPAQLAFGNVTVGACSPAQSIAITNEGCGNLQGDPSIMGPDAGHFQCVSGCGSFNLGPGQSWPLGVRFCPTSAGPKSAMLRVTSNDTNESPCDRPLLGNGQAPSINIVSPTQPQPDQAYPGDVVTVTYSYDVMDNPCFDPSTGTQVIIRIVRPNGEGARQNVICCTGIFCASASNATTAFKIEDPFYLPFDCYDVTAELRTGGGCNCASPGCNYACLLAVDSEGDAVCMNARCPATLEIDPPSGTLAPGGQTFFSAIIHNTTGTQDEYSFEFGGVGPGWTSYLDDSTPTVPAGDTRTIAGWFHSPSDAEIGSCHYPTLWLRSGNCDTIVDEASMQVCIGSPPEAVSAPWAVSGPTQRMVDEVGAYLTGGSVSSLGHPVEYRFNWGDGTPSSWGAPSAQHSWSAPGTYGVTAQARCQLHPNIISPPSNPPLQVSVGQPLGITVLHPCCGESVVRGTTFRIEWSATGIPNPVWRFFLNQGGVFYQPLFPTPVNDGGGAWHADWIVPSNLQSRCDYDLAVKDDSTGMDDHSDTFCVERQSLAVEKIAPMGQARVGIGGTHRAWYRVGDPSAEIVISSDYATVTQMDSAGYFTVEVNTSALGIDPGNLPVVLDSVCTAAWAIIDGQTWSVDESLFTYPLTITAREYESFWDFQGSSGLKGGIVAYIRGDIEGKLRLSYDTQDTFRLQRYHGGQVTFGAAASLFELEAGPLSVEAPGADAHVAAKVIRESGLVLEYSDPTEEEKAVMALYFLTSVIGFGGEQVPIVPLAGPLADALYNYLVSQGYLLEYQGLGFGLSVGGGVNLVDASVGPQSDQRKIRADLAGVTAGVEVEAGGLYTVREYESFDRHRFEIFANYFAGIGANVLGADLLNLGPGGYLVSGLEIDAYDSGPALGRWHAAVESDKPFVLDTKEVILEFGDISPSAVYGQTVGNINTPQAVPFNPVLWSAGLVNAAPNGDAEVLASRGLDVDISLDLGITVFGIQLELARGLGFESANSYTEDVITRSGWKWYPTETYPYDAYVQNETISLPALAAHIFDLTLWEHLFGALANIWQMLVDPSGEQVVIATPMGVIVIAPGTVFTEEARAANSAGAESVTVTIIEHDAPSPLSCEGTEWFARNGINPTLVRTMTGDGFVVNRLLEIEPFNAHFSPAAELVMYYSDEMAQGKDEGEFKVFQWQEEMRVWFPLASSVDTEANTVATTINRFGSFAVGYDVLGPEIVFPGTGQPYLGELDLQVSIVDEGAGVDVSTIQVTLDAEPVDFEYSASGLLSAHLVLPDGTHTVTVEAADVNGNVSNQGTQIENVVPGRITSITRDIPAGDGIIVLSWTHEIGTFSVDHFSVYRDGVHLTEAATSPYETVFEPGLYSVYPVDEAGYVGEGKSTYAPPILGDCDREGDVDLTDYAIFLRCFQPMGGNLSDDCTCGDFDGDADVDLHDFAAFQAAFTGTICGEPELAVVIAPVLPNGVGPNDLVTGAFDWSFYSGDGQAPEAAWTNVFGWRDTAGYWTGPEPMTFYNGAPGRCPGHSQNGELISIAAPSLSGIYDLWAQAFPGLDQDAAVAEFELTTTRFPTNLAKILGTVAVTNGSWDQAECEARGGFWGSDGLGGNGCWFQAADNTTCDDCCGQVDLTCADGQWNDDSQCTILNHFVGNTCHCIPNEDPKGFCPAFWGGTPECGFRQNVDVNCADLGYPGHNRICVCEP